MSLPDLSQTPAALPAPGQGRSARIRRTRSAYSAQDIATLRLLIEAHCTTPAIARHFNVTEPAIKMLMRRLGIKRARPTVAEILAATVDRRADPRALPLAAAPEVTDQIPTVMLLDRFEKYDGMVELHEVGPHGMARVKRAVGAGAGKWLTVPVLLLRFERAQDRAALIAAAKERHAATQARRAALQQQASDTP